jgi:tetratricopeptide (TPR) repeat protein
MISVEKALSLADTLIFDRTGKHLNELQTIILKQVLQKRKYLEIADFYGCTEGHIKDIAYLLWKLLSEALGEKITKNNFRVVLERKLHSQFMGESISPLKFETTNFVGRENSFIYLDRLIAQGNQIIVIQGEGGIGKTTLAQNYLQKQNFEVVLEVLMAKETQNITSAENIIEEWLKKDFQEEPGREFGVTLGRLKRHLETQKIGILIDNLEPALDKYGKVIAIHRRYVELLRVLADLKVKSVTLITSRDRLCEPDLSVCHYRLPGLEVQAWQKFFSFHQLNLDRSILKSIHKTYGGNAKAMGIIRGAIAEDFDGDINAYWAENQHDPLGEIELSNLVSSQFERLKNLDWDAYLLLCRLGCYRYQDIPTISKAGLKALLWKLEDSQHQRIIESLKNRSLIEYSKGNYWLHPVIRTEAIARLKASNEWSIVNVKAAEYWTSSIKKIITLEDALTALEAYYHYVEIQDFERAAKVILKSRDNQWGQFLPLGSTLYRLGLVHPILTAITQIIERVKSPHHLSELHNILGDLYWITGKINRAIAAQEKTITLATQCLTLLNPNDENKLTLYYLKMLKIDSLLSIGLYKIDLWELQEAATYFQTVIDLTEGTAHYRWGQKAYICLALVNSYLKSNRITFFQDEILEKPEKIAYFLQLLGQTYANNGEMKKALEIYAKAIAFSQESHYTQVKGKTLTGLAEIYRQQQQFEQAIAYHLEAIELLEKIGAKCDLAEAYFQLGLTYQVISYREQETENFERAIQLFTEMEASKQVEKVKERMN